MESGPPRVHLQRLADYEPEGVLSALRSLVGPLGGIEAFVQPGQTVVLKPNLVMAFDAARAVTTHPAVVRAAALLCLEAGAMVRVGDSPGIHSAKRVCETAGIAAALADLPVEIIEFTPMETVDPARTFKHLALARELLEADVVINLPKLKTHCMMGLTMAVKNCFGAVVGPMKFQWHYRAGLRKEVFARMLHEIAAAVAPALSIVDAVVAMDGDGPTAGTPNPTGFLAAGSDPWAVDAVLCDVVGVARDQLWTLAAAAEAGVTAWREAEVLGESPAALRPSSWTPPSTESLAMHGPRFIRDIPFLGRWVRAAVTAKPVVSKRCVRCGACVKVCPADAMTLDAAGVRIDKEACIRCYCCHELCPHDAIDLQRGLLASWIQRASR